MRYGAKYAIPVHRGGDGRPGRRRGRPGRRPRAHPPPVVARIRRVLPPGRGRGGGAGSAPRAHRRSPRGTAPTGSPELLADRTAEPPWRRSTPAASARTAVFFTAHSLPLRVVAEGDPYPDQVAESAADVAALLDLDDEPGLTWGVAWQSAGRTADPGSAPTSWSRSPGGRRGRHRRGGLPGRLRLRPPRDPLRPRHRGRAGGPVGSGWPSPGPPSLNDDPRFLGGAGRRGAPGAPAPGAAPRSRPATPPGVTAGVADPPWPWSAAASPGWPRPGSWWQGRTGPDAGAGRGRSSSRPATGRAASSVRRVRRATRGPGRRRLPGPPARGHRAVRRARRSADELVPVGATGASIWARGRLRPMPDGLQPRGPHPLVAARSGSGILGPGESLRVARDLVIPHRGDPHAPGRPGGGQIVEERLGRPVVDRLVDPLIGGIHAGGVDDLSAAATFPAAPRRLPPVGEPDAPPRRRPGRPQPAERPGRRPSTADFWSLAGQHRQPGRRAGRGPGRAGRDHPHRHGVARRRARGTRPAGRRRVALTLGRPVHGPGAGRTASEPPALQADGVVLAVPAAEAGGAAGSARPGGRRACSAPSTTPRWRW